MMAYQRPKIPASFNTPPFAVKTQPGLLELQRNMIRMLEGALKFYAPDAPELNKLQEMRDAIGKAS